MITQVYGKLLKISEYRSKYPKADAIVYYFMYGTYRRGPFPSVLDKYKRPKHKYMSAELQRKAKEDHIQGSNNRVKKSYRLKPKDKK